jgi:hypothetical protein
MTHRDILSMMSHLIHAHVLNASPSMRIRIKESWDFSLLGVVFAGTIILLAGTKPLSAANFTKVVIPDLRGLPSQSSSSLAWGDYDNDNQLDFLVAGDGSTQLWRNTGTGFIRIQIPGLPGVGEGSVAWGDYDNDGWLDFVLTGMAIVGNTTPTVAQLWRNTGSGFTQIPVPGLQGVWMSDVAWADYDNDGRLDFLLSGSRTFANGPRLSQLWRNTGSGFVLVPIPGLPGLENSSIAWGDYDDDGWIDFLIMGTTNGMYASSGPSTTDAAVTQLRRNTGNGFEEVAIPGLPRVFLGKVAWGDFDNDGWLDFLITGSSGMTRTTPLWRNTGNGFEQVVIPGIASNIGGTVAWADYDNDGWLDFLLIGGETQLWRNTGGNFQLDPVPGLPQNGVPSLAWADYDRDGLVDFLMTGFDGFQEPGNTHFTELWRNAGAVTNSPPTPPTGLSVSTSAGVTTIDWLPGTDDRTPASALSYNLRVGTQPGAADIVSPHADSATGFRRLAAPGNAGSGTNALLRLPPGNYYASVQAVDAAWDGGPFSVEAAFSTLPALSIERRGSNLVLAWTTPDAGYELQSSETLDPTNWIAAPPGTTSPLLLNPDETPRFFRLRKP